METWKDSIRWCKINPLCGTWHTVPSSAGTRPNCSDKTWIKTVRKPAQMQVQLRWQPHLHVSPRSQCIAKAQAPCSNMKNFTMATSRCTVMVCLWVSPAKGKWAQTLRNGDPSELDLAHSSKHLKRLGRCRSIAERGSVSKIKSHLLRFEHGLCLLLWTHAGFHPQMVILRA
jgi:hypothetical protein